VNRAIIAATKTDVKVQRVDSAAASSLTVDAA
jgi:hypothetical protein